MFKIPEKFTATIFWSDSPARVKLVFYRITNLATFYLQVAPPVWCPMYEDFDLCDPETVDLIDNVIGLENRRALFQIIAELRLNSHRSSASDQTKQI